MTFAFVYDESKSRVNKQKHGIDFVEAQALWLDDRQIEFAARSGNELRYLIVGLIGCRH